MSQSRSGVRPEGIPAVQLKKNTVYFTFLKVLFYSHGPHLSFFSAKKASWLVTKRLIIIQKEQ